MVILPVAGAVVSGAITSAITLACGRNMAQTFLACQAANRQDHQGPGQLIAKRLQAASTLVRTTTTTRTMQSGRREGDPTTVPLPPLVVEEMKALNRRELLELFLSCSPQVQEKEQGLELSSLRGEWNGELLSNNLVLTSVTRFITYVIFGNGRKWNGKAFQETNRGYNRFVSKNPTGASSDDQQIEISRNFDYSIAPSTIDRQAFAVRNVYKRHYSRISLWHTMVDELRVVPLPETSDIELLIGMGWMGWSGGSLNASPFCLWRKKRTSFDPSLR